MNPNPEIPADVLLSHASGLRALARGLLCDEHAAEDVLQETWIAALERPPMDRVSLGAWLRQVARCLALKRRRGEGRRTRREHLVSRDEGLEAVDDVLSERELLRGVVEAVLALDEPYQSVVILRYYQDLSPAQIAAREEIPLATVKSHLHRARGKLRARLDAHAGGARSSWALALASLTGWNREALVDATAAGTASTGTFLGGIAVHWKILAGAASVATIVLGASTWSSTSQLIRAETGSAQAGESLDEPQLAASSEDLRTPARASAGQSSERTPAQGARVRVAAAPSLPAAEHAFVLGGLVVDENDLPVSGAELYLAPGLHPLSSWGKTAVDGSFHLAWQARQPEMSVVLWVQAPGSDAGMMQIELRAGAPKSLRIATRAPRLLRRDLVDEHRAKLEKGVADGAFGDLHKLRRLKLDALLLRDLNQELSFSAAPVALIELSNDVDASYPFVWPSRIPVGEGWVDLDTVIGELKTELEFHEFQGRLARVEKLNKLDHEKKTRKRFGALGYFSEDAPEEAKVVISGSVRTSSGEPVREALVVWTESGKRRSVKSTKDGSFRLTASAGRILGLRAGGGDHGLAVESFDLRQAEDGSEYVWEPLLDRGQEVRGHINDSDGKPLDGWVVEFVSTRGAETFSDKTRSRTGSFAIPNVPERSGELRLRRSASQPFVDQIVSDVRPGPEELGVVVSLREPGALKLELKTPEGEPLEGADVRLWQADSGRGSAMNWDVEQRAYALSELPPGSYRVVAGSTERGYLDLGLVEITAGETSDLGALNVPAAGGLSVLPELDPDRDAGGLTWTLLHRGPAVESWVAAGTLEGLFPTQLPAGDYLMLIGGDDCALPAMPFSVEAGVAQELSLPITSYRSVSLRFAPPAVGNEAAAPEGGVGPLRFSVNDSATGALVYRHTLGDGLETRLFLREGEYRLDFQHGAESVTTSFSVGAEPATLIEVELPPRSGG